jgi:FMN reductase
MSVVAISGSLSNPSRSSTLAQTTAEIIARSLNSDALLLRVADHGAALGGATALQQLPEAIAALYSEVFAAQVLVIATPVYKASYTGLLKHFFDLIDPQQLQGKVVVLAATGGSDHHALVIEHQLRPLLGFFGAYTVPTGLYVKDSDFDKDAATQTYRLTHPTALQRVATAAAQAVVLLNQQRSAA